jgi:hypothetical protein
MTWLQCNIEMHGLQLQKRRALHEQKWNMHHCCCGIFLHVPPYVAVTLSTAASLQSTGSGYLAALQPVNELQAQE